MNFYKNKSLMNYNYYVKYSYIPTNKLNYYYQ